MKDSFQAIADALSAHQRDRRAPLSADYDRAECMCNQQLRRYAQYFFVDVPSSTACAELDRQSFAAKREAHTRSPIPVSFSSVN
jgi:hypothetical protein